MRAQYRHITASAVLLFAALFSFGQNNLTLYNMKPIPQKFYANPAQHSDAKIFVGLPAVSSNYLDVGFSTFTFSDILNAIETDQQGNNTFVVSKFAEGFKKRNEFSLTNSIDILAIGVKVKKNYFYLNSTLHSDIRLSFPGDLFKFLAEGNGGSNLDRKFDFGFGFDALQYSELGLGYSREIIKDKLTIGGRLRFLKGLSVINTAKSEFTFTTDKETYDYLLATDIEINTANSIQNFDGFDPLDSNSQAPDVNTTASEVITNFLLSGNRGTAIDLGVRYNISNKFSLSASVINLGRIHWNQNNYNWKSRNPGATYRYSGIEVDDAFNYSDQDREQQLEDLADTIKQTFDLDENNNEFNTGLFAQFYVGGNLNFTKNHNAGVLLYGNFYKKRIDPAITFSWNSKFTRILGVSVTYSVLNNSFYNAGLGMSLNLGPVQYYLVSDNLIGLFAHRQANTINLRTGLNVTIGRKEKKDDAQ